MKTYKSLNPQLRRPSKDSTLKYGLISLILCSIITSSLIFIFNGNYQVISESNDKQIYDNVIDKNEISLNPSAGIELFQDPFTVNFEDMTQFFINKYKSDLNFEVDTYYREGDATGSISDDTVYPVDTILWYNTLYKEELTEEQTFSNYLALKNSPFWYDNGGFNYGFITSVDNATNSIIDDRRSLTDNLMVISLLIDNIGENINNFNINNVYPKDSIEEIFYLINSSQFWDEINDGFSQFNSTDFTENKFSKSNFYAILTTLQIRNLYERLNLEPQIKNRAYSLANKTMDAILLNMWDDVEIGFYYNAKSDWDTSGLSGSTYKYLDVNALGIITLLEYWLETGKNDDSHLDKAIATFQKIDNYLWNPTYEAYQFNKDKTWGISGQNQRIELEANSLMMLACLKLFEVTGNFTYYDRAFQLHNTFETSFYDTNSYTKSIFTPIDNARNLNANLKLVKTYMKAFEIYASTVLNSNYNVTSEIPDFIFDQEVLSIQSNYYVNNTVQYYNYSTQGYQDYEKIYNITSAGISYIFKYPNQTLLDIKEQVITSNSITLEYEINQSISIGDGYYLYIYSNTSYFGTAQVLKRFNVVSGLEVFPIIGLPSILYQGPTFNITLPVNNTRNDNINLTVTMQGKDIFEKSQLKNFPKFVLSNVSFELAARLGASIGPQNITFTFKDGNFIYLKLIKTINFGYSIDYQDFLFQNQVVSGDSFQVFFNLVNFLPNVTQSCNISFSGDYIYNYKQQLILDQNEVRALYYDIITFDNIIEDIIEIRLDISKGGTVLYSRTFSISILPEYEILSASFPERVVQGEIATFIMLIKNNRKISQSYVLYVKSDGQILDTINGGLAPGENHIKAEVLPTLFPYDFFDRSYIFELRDESGELITQYYYKISIEISPANILLFYVLPLVIPIGILLFYKNKELKHKQLRR